MLRRVLVTSAAVLSMLVAGSLPVASAAQVARRSVGADQASADGRGHDGDYLALGDSVPFGFNPLVPVGSAPSSYVGYPELGAARLDLRVTNLSCPGQTSSGFLSLSGTDNGCFAFRRAAALHTGYHGTQQDAAVAFLRSHPRTRLVTLMIGANDLLLCARATADKCTNPTEVAATLHTTAANLEETLTAIRAVYHGPLVAVTYYATNYADPAGVAAVTALDHTLSTVSARFGGVVADAFTPFKQRSAAFAGSDCRAGLLIPLTTGGCDIHPTSRGAHLLAAAVVRADRAADRAVHRATA